MLSSPVGTVRTDTAAGSTTNTSFDVVDANALVTDIGSLITGTNIPPGAIIVQITGSPDGYTGTGYTLSAAATGTGSGLTFTITKQFPLFNNVEMLDFNKRIADGATVADTVLQTGQSVLFSRLSQTSDNLATGELVPPDRHIAYGSSTVASLTTSQQLNLHYFTASRTEAITQIETISGSTAAAATPTICRVGIYDLAANGDGTLIASTTNDTAMWSATLTAYPKALNVTFNKVAGKRYAVAVLCVSAAAMPVLMSPAFINTGILNSHVGRTPILCGLLAGQADLPANFTAASIGTNSIMFTFRLVP